ncbi:MAG: hypothetical protein A3D92_13810 [Bacteroidetes bacterium RIFCSPHIGHO2_02_FULL_44_7]|nr:MAG: hypothetical protein A3D92_13810 [Bacteroidetes bacterium RIFCSPHIGHO2_02_FULL_44_7]
MKGTYLFLIVAGLCTFARCQDHAESVYPKNAVAFSQNFLLAIKTEQPYGTFRDTLKTIDLGRLEKELRSPEQKLAFWINTYNSLVQAKIRDDVSAFEDQSNFFKTADQEIGGTKVSLDDIESGILRLQPRSTNKAFFKTFRVAQIDPRIHFTLNCGATSCPPVAFYSPEKLEEELAAAELSFVTQTSKYDAVENQVTISELFDWYAADFGGKAGVIQLLKRLGIVPQAVEPEIRYSTYDWHLDIENY